MFSPSEMSFWPYIPTLWVDLDGVLADFDRAYEDLFGEKPDRSKPDRPKMWETIHAKGDFFLTMPEMPDAQELWSFVRDKKVGILTGAPNNVPISGEQKIQWVRNRPWIDKTVPVVTCQSKKKCLFCKKNDILIDDWEKYKQKWIDAGGIWITHKSAKETIGILKPLDKYIFHPTIQAA